MAADYLTALTGLSSELRGLERTEWLRSVLREHRAVARAEGYAEKAEADICSRPAIARGVEGCEIMNFIVDVGLKKLYGELARDIGPGVSGAAVKTMATSGAYIEYFGDDKINLDRLMQAMVVESAPNIY